MWLCSKLVMKILTLFWCLYYYLWANYIFHILVWCFIVEFEQVNGQFYWGNWTGNPKKFATFPQRDLYTQLPECKPLTSLPFPKGKSSRWRCSMKEDFLEIGKVRRKSPVSEYRINKVARIRTATSFQKRLQHMFFFSKFCEAFKNACFTDHLQGTGSEKTRYPTILQSLAWNVLNALSKVCDGTLLQKIINGF